MNWNFDLLLINLTEYVVDRYFVVGQSTKSIIISMNVQFREFLNKRGSESFDASIRRCTIGGCGRQFASIQLLNQHMRRDHFVGGTNAGAAAPMRDHAVAAQHGGLGSALFHSGAGERIRTHCIPTRRTLVAVRGGGPRTRTSFYMRASALIRAARRLAPRPVLSVRRSARHPFEPINAAAVRQHCAALPCATQQRQRAPPRPAHAPLAASPQKPGAKPIAAPTTPREPAAVPVVAAAVAGLPQKRTQNGQSWVASTAPPAAKRVRAADGSAQPPLPAVR